jgi:hypothetical protein
MSGVRTGPRLVQRVNRGTSRRVRLVVVLRVAQIALILGACSEVASDVARAAPDPVASDWRRFDLPVREWTPRDLPVLGQGPIPRGHGGKHARLFVRTRTGDLILTGGDYQHPSMSAQDNGSQMVWMKNLDDSSPEWRVLGAWCHGPVMPGRPDNVLWAYDSKRDKGVIMPGFYFANQRGSTICPGVVEDGGPFFFNFGTNLWEPADIPRPPDGWGGDLGATFGVYDPVTDSVLRVRFRGDPQVEQIKLGTTRWQTTRLFFGNITVDPHADQSVIDVQGRAIYFIARATRSLVKYGIDSRRILRQIPLPPALDVSQPFDQETYLAFDSINRVVLFPNTHDYGGTFKHLGIYHVDRGRWEVEAVPAGVFGNILTFDPTRNCLVLMGGNGSRAPHPTRFWLYRYGTGEAGAPR